MISPGTAKTSRPSSSAKSAVIRAPLRSRASTTTVAVAQARDDAVAGREPPRRRLDAGRILGGDQAALADPAGELAVGRGIVAVDAAAEDRYRRAARLERAPVRLGVDAARQAAHDDDAGAASSRPSDRATCEP